MTFREVVIFIVLVVAPLVPLTLTWTRVFKPLDKRASSTALVRVEVAIATASFVLLTCSLVWTSILGPEYSHRRLGMIYGSLIVMVTIAVASAFGTKRLKSPLMTSAIILALAWAYMAVVNSVV